MTESKSDAAKRREDLSFIRRTFLVLLMAAALVGLIALGWELRVLIIDMVLALTVASTIAPLGDALQTKRLPRAVTVLAVYSGVVIFYAGVGWGLSVPITEQARLLAQQLPQLSLTF